VASRPHWARLIAPQNIEHIAKQAPGLPEDTRKQLSGRSNSLDGGMPTIGITLSNHDRIEHHQRSVQRLQPTRRFLRCLGVNADNAMNASQLMLVAS
jgi:hypothetical protein